MGWLVMKCDDREKTYAVAAEVSFEFVVVACAGVGD